MPASKGPATASNGPDHGNSACNGIVHLLHDWFCQCIWCLVQGHK
jgi:hypothetical protein